MVEVKNLDSEIYATTKNLIASLGTYNKFINLFAQACDTLGFPQVLKFMDKDRFNDLCEIAHSMKVTGETLTTNEKLRAMGK
jgi:hypothetical protein